MDSKTFIPKYNGSDTHGGWICGACDSRYVYYPERKCSKCNAIIDWKPALVPYYMNEEGYWTDNYLRVFAPDYQPSKSITLQGKPEEIIDELNLISNKYAILDKHWCNNELIVVYARSIRYGCDD